MNARKRRATRRRAIRKTFPIGACVKYIHFDNGAWEVYGHDGQKVKLRRHGMTSGYLAYAYELRRTHTQFLALKPESWRPSAF